MAAASYAFPNAGLHSGGHAHSHSRKSMTQRVPLQPTSMNGGHSISGGPLINDLKFHANTQASSQEQFPDADDHFDSTTELPAAHLHSQNSSAMKRPKVMDRRRSVGLPTHLSLRDSGYGYQPASNQKFMPIDEEAERKWITPSETISVVLIPTPLILASLIHYHGNTTPSPTNLSTASRLVESVSEDFRTSKVTLLTFELGALSACIITSMVLVLMGLGGKFLRTADAPIRRKASYPNSADMEKPQLNRVALATVRSIIGRILSVALPFYAAAKLGANRVALIMLVALATNLMTIDGKSTDLTSIRNWKRLLLSQRWTLASILLQIGCDFVGLTNQSAMNSAWMGYVALGVSILALPPPFPSSKPRTSAGPSADPRSTSAGSAVLAKPEVVKPTDITLSPLICTNEDTNLTLVAGGLLAVLSCIVLFVSKSGAGALHPKTLGWLFFSACTAVLSYTITQAQSIRHSKGLGLVFGALLCALVLTVLHHDSWTSSAYQGVFISISFAAIKQDTRSLFSKSAHPHHETHSHHHHGDPHRVHHDHPSRFSEALLRLFQHWPILHSILAEKDSRRIFYFMTLNFAFMLVQTFYGIATGSLGLLSDSVHMFFDCLALVVGLCAAVMSKWPPSTRFPYGFGKVDTLAGFANGIFLMLISVEIVYEALERLSEGVEMQRIGELLTVSSLGLGVNLIGMTAFGHAHHGHSHGGHDHSEHSHQGHGHAHDVHHDHSLHTHQEHPEHEHHDHGHQGHSHVHETPDTSSTTSPYSIPPTPSKPVHTHSHAHGHGHSHGNENMHGIFLHVLADTLGSVAVVISTLLIHYYGWAGFDPLASCLIAILIFASAIPLVTSSARTLLLTIPEKTEFDLREALAGVSGLRGVVGYAVPKFWLDEGEERRVLGVIHIVAGKGTDMGDVKERAVALLKARNMNVLVQVEREGSSSCWCQGTINR